MSNKIKFLSRRTKRKLLEKLAAVEQGSEEAKNIREQLGPYAPVIDLPAEPVVEAKPEPVVEAKPKAQIPKHKTKKAAEKTTPKPKSKTRSISSKK